MDKLNFKLGNEVKRAKKNNLPIVALETTIVSHGMPYPQNIETALNAEKIIKEEGAMGVRTFLRQLIFSRRQLP